ncbi:hypothetical protein M0D69_06870 [Caballeronia sp. SEWSISQ10-4 2]|uniref:hypothetical protein n=1 Tax=Caballeronia sp. SEWSISQ10-4 2 TaxID=2937438 RepID=UPI0026554C52|nr:hypothetical protein [Caballeronia sp. SEWSISQ10-4 2]MDN7177743.1 hypothetical protein [Caballeronia sp. SEWSISQ10-4 2]
MQRFDTPTIPVIFLGDLNEWLIDGRALRRPVSHFYRACSADLPHTLSVVRFGLHPGERLVCVDVHRSPFAWAASDHDPLIAAQSMSL